MTSEAAWVVVADGARARFFVRTRQETPLEELKDLDITADEVRKLHHQSTLVHDGANHRHNGKRERHDGHDADERQFPAHIAGRIELLARENGAIRFVLCAPPRALGALRDHLSLSVRKRIIAEIPKDIVRDQLREIDARLMEHKV